MNKFLKSWPPTTDMELQLARTIMIPSLGTRLIIMSTAPIDMALGKDARAIIAIKLNDALTQ